MNKLCILFVDDEQQILDGLRRVLHKQKNEWEMTFLTDPLKALSVVENASFDVVVTDMSMPGMNGLEFLKEVTKRDPKTVRIVLSGESSDREAVLAAVNIAHQFLLKPCDTETLKAAMASSSTVQTILNDENLRNLVSQLNSLPSLPEIYIKIMEEIKKPDASIDLIGKIISEDMAMSARLLQLANSAFFGIRRHIVSPAEAVIYLGLDTVNDLVLIAKVFSRCEQAGTCALSLKSLWDHSLTTGAFAKQIAIAENASNETVGYALTSGLLHDIGKLVLVSNLPDKYMSVLELSAKEEKSLTETEKEIFGATHAEVGACLIGLWGLPNPILEAVLFHHYPVDSHAKEFSPLTAVHTADAFEHELTTKDLNIRQLPIDEMYLNDLGLAEHLPIWRQTCLKISEDQTASEKS